ncbi:MFS transporter [Dongia sp.]|uniref:MFS transporter n=1 Tax=Dongia sp. TaxID=1977262 RepID=UPI0035B3BDFD
MNTPGTINHADQDRIDWRTLIAACAAVCVFAFSLGEMFPLLALNMESWGVSEAMIGLNTAMAPVGILLAGLIIPLLSHAFGGKRVAIFMASATGLLFLLYPTFPSLWAWFPLRLLQGIFVATLFALSEAWVLGNAKGAIRGRVVGIYATSISATFGVGAAVVGWTGIAGYLPFVIGAGILFLAVLPISMVSADADGDEDRQHVSMLSFLPKAPLLLFAIVVHAMFDGGMLGFLSVYGVRHGMDDSTAALTITALSLGNVFFQIPIGWIADRTSKRKTMVGCFLVASTCLAMMPFAIATILIWPLVLVAGAAGFGIYTVGLAELGDRFSGPDLIAGTSAFSTMWGLGALIGAAICGVAMDVFGPHGFPLTLLAVFIAYLVILALITWRRQRRA